MAIKESMDKAENVRLNQQIQSLNTELSKLEKEKRLLEIELGDTIKMLERYRLITDFAHDWEMWYNPDGSIEYISPSFQTITGYAPAELQNNPGLLSIIIYPTDYEAYLSYINDALNFVVIRRSYRFRILTRTKQLRWCEIKCKAVYNKKGKYLGQRASIGDITTLMNALGQIKDLSEGKQYESMAKEKYQRDLENKDRELMGFMLAISQKNETLQFVSRQLDKISRQVATGDNAIIREMKTHVVSSLMSAETWENFKEHFDRLNPGFFERLYEKYPGLSNRDLRICGYIKLGLSTKEIAVLQNITFKSAEISRVRLRRKLGLERKTNLQDFLNSI